MLGKIFNYFTLSLFLCLLWVMPPRAGWAQSAPEGFNPGPDIITGDIGELGGLEQFGQSGSQVGLGVSTTSCNIGDMPVGFFAMPETNHPVIPHNLYRMSGGSGNDERFEQIGQSWAKHAFGADEASVCSVCTHGGAPFHLGVGCSDTYDSSQNATQGDLGSRALINPFTGVFQSTARDHTGHIHTGTSHRILVEGSDLNTTLNPGATYYAEVQYISPEEYAWCQTHPAQCNMYNNASYRRYDVTGTTSFTFSEVGPAVRMKAAINAWTGATINPIEPEPGVDGRAFIGYKVTGPVAGVWHYEYALYNENLDRGIQSFSVPAVIAPAINGTEVSISNVGFHAPPQHPGFANDGTQGNAGYSSVPWSFTQTAESLTWTSETLAQNPNANALRWGTLYNFRFDTSRPPVASNATVGFFKTGAPITVAIQGPAPIGGIPTPTPTVPPGATPTPSPTVTPGGTPTPTPIPTATATATPAASLTPAPSATATAFPTPILPPAGNGKIVFESDRGLSPRNLYVMDANGSNQINLTNDLSLDYYASWSPDGTKIAFSSDRDGIQAMYVMNADGSNVIRVINNTVDEYEHRWSPDGTKFVFVSTRDGNPEIYVMNVDGANQIRLTNTPGEEVDPRWSPDGGKIAFETNRDGNREIYVMNADGSNQTNLTNNGASDHNPAWSPDGTKIAFRSSRNGQGIFVMNRDGTNVTRLTTGNDGGPAWSPDGTKLAFHRSGPNPGDDADIFMVNPDGSNVTNITNNPSVNIRPDWQRIAFPPAQALNLSTRMHVQTGDGAGIGGFIITGSAPVHVLLRALGPTLSVEFDRLADPIMELHRPGAATITNDNWRDDPEQEAAIIATGLPPTNNLESAIDTTLNPGAYTAVVRGKNNTSGRGLLEIYDLSQAVPAKLANISTRAFVSTGADVLIAGFILGGHNGADRVVVRGIGPSLTALGVANALANPTLELRDGNGALVLGNNDWQDDPAQAAQLTAAGLAPTSNLESGIVATIPPDLYTALLAGLNNGTGVGLVEVYDLGIP